MAKASRTKGQAYEREALRLLQQSGAPSRRTSASGAMEGYTGDIEVELLGGLDVEVKYSGVDRGAGTLRRYLGPVHMVMARAPGEEWMFVMKPDVALALLRTRWLMEQHCPDLESFAGEPPLSHDGIPDDGQDGNDASHGGGWMRR